MRRQDVVSILAAPGRVTSTGDLNKPQQGDEYSVAYTEQAKAARAQAYGKTTSTTGTGNGKGTLTQSTLTSSPW